MTTKTSLRALSRPEDFGHFVARSTSLSTRQIMSARAQATNLGSTLLEVLRAEDMLSDDTLTETTASFLNLPVIDLEEMPPTPELSRLIDPSLSLRYRVLPWRKDGKHTIIAAANSEDYLAFLEHVDGSRADYEMVLAKADQIINYVTAAHRSLLVERASSRVSEMESCRTWEKHTSKHRLAAVTIFLVSFIAVTIFYSGIVFAAFAIWAIATLLISAILRMTAYVAETSDQPENTPPDCRPHELPNISVLVPLFKEREIANVLLKRLARLTYPKAKLDVVLVVEEFDATTRSTLKQIRLPPWIRVVVVPEGTPKTKPRAMNYALDFCRGDIIGIWDAEDAPAPDQLETVASHFMSSPEDVVCLQGVLDYYNSDQNWLARCFTIEYAAWFRLILPGMARLGFAIPLGGTTLFFKRNALEALGGWDAHNVTEDADLGFRLARHGFRTDVIPTRTGEEANCKAWPWVRQRSRWLKGYLVTYLVHMRQPLVLWKQLGSWRFLGFQAHFVTALSQFILAPVLWSFWLVLFGLPHPMEHFVSKEVLFALGVSFLLIELLNALINATAVSRPSHRHLLAWVPTMHFYYPLGAIAAYKALYELIFNPFYWDKTKHGLSLSHVPRKKEAPLGGESSSVQL